MKLILVPLSALVFCGSASAENIKTPPARETHSRGIGQFFLPQSLQKNPEIALTIVSEVTELGKKIAAASADRPIYYVMQPGWYQSLGRAASRTDKPPPVPQLEYLVKEALKTNGFLEAGAGHPGSIAVIFTYGSHQADNAEFEDAIAESDTNAAYNDAAIKREQEIELMTAMNVPVDDDAAFIPSPTPSTGGVKTARELLPYVMADRQKLRETVERATLVGGTAFAKELTSVFVAEGHYRRSLTDTDRLAAMGREDREQTFLSNGRSGGSVAGWMNFDLPAEVQIGSPFNRFYQRDAQTARLIEAAFGSCYFIVASAYDGRAMERGEKRLLWRTKMTVNSIGVSMTETFPTLIASGGPYLGRETPKPITVFKRSLREGRVDVGAPAVLEAPEAAPAHRPAPNAAESR